MRGGWREWRGEWRGGWWVEGGWSGECGGWGMGMKGGSLGGVGV